MSYFIFSKNLDDVTGTIYRIAENQSDLNNLNINQLDYKIIEDSQENFDFVKYGTKNIVKYNNNIITYEDKSIIFADEIKDGVLLKSGKQCLNEYISNYKTYIKQFTNNNNINHPLYNRWNNYYNQLNSLNLDSIQYPLNTSLEQYFKDQNLTSLHPLQIP
jgi:hypothetical protein